MSSPIECMARLDQLLGIHSCRSIDGSCGGSQHRLQTENSASTFFRRRALQQTPEIVVFSTFRSSADRSQNFSTRDGPSRRRPGSPHPMVVPHISRFGCVGEWANTSRSALGMESLAPLVLCVRRPPAAVSAEAFPHSYEKNVACWATEIGV